MRSSRPPDLEWVIDARQAADLLEPLRARILKLARKPSSSTQLGIELGLPRQRVNYHVRELSRSGLLKRAVAQTQHVRAALCRLRADVCSLARAAGRGVRGLARGH